ncbi:MAG: adenylate kinase [Bacteroidales bacterium]|nr:adenylate kinase [Bacteroidales bacterium]
MLNLALFGPPGAGKGTQSTYLIEKYGLSYISTGEILRQEIKQQSDLGLQAKSVIESGGLVSDEIIVQIIEKFIVEHKDSKGFLFDGFPRTYIQAYILEGLLMKLHTQLMSLINIDITDKEAIQRLIKRGEDSNRADDNLEVIQNRLKAYHQKTLPVLEFYKQKGNLVEINGMGSIPEIQKRISKSVETTLSKQWLNIVLFGAPGSGRATFGRQLAKQFNLEYISTGDILQEEIDRKGDFGQIIQDFMNKGSHVPDEIVVRLLEKRIAEKPKTQGFVFKGFPRTIIQAYILDGLLRKHHTSINTVINFEVPTLDLISRLEERGKTAHAMPYDKSIESIVHRLREHEKKTIQVLDFYKKQKRVIDLDGTQDKEKTYGQLVNIVQEQLKQFRD